MSAPYAAPWPLRERLGSGDGVDHRLRGHVLLGHRKLPLRPLLADAVKGRSRDLVEELRQRMSAQAQPRELPDQGRSVAAQRRFLERAQGLFTELGGPLRHAGREGPSGLVLPFLHERGHVAEPELAVTAGCAKALDLTSVGPALDGCLADSEQRRDLACR